jgi:hypothetical protein
MRSLKMIRYQVFLLSLAAGNLSLGLWVFDYCVLFLPSWTPDAADRLFGFGPWFNYLSSGAGLLLVATSIVGLWLACLMWLLPGRLSDCKSL